MVSSWFSRNRKLLKAAWGVLALICVAEVISLRQVGEMTLDHSEFVLLFALPFFLFGVVHLALMYGNWFQMETPSGFVAIVKRSIFWLSLVAFPIILGGFISRFGGQVW